MCGRFAFYSPREAVTELFGIELPLELEPRYNVAPTQQVLAIRADGDGAQEPSFLRWGLVPSWAKDPAIGNRMINARSETVREKPAFRAAFKRRRCVLLADGFYEWRAQAGGKQPYFIGRADRQPFAMAGLWEHWEKGPEPIESCTIITTVANEQLGELHHRMPVILDRADVSDWIGATNPDDAQALLKPFTNGLLEYWPVSRQVNSPKNDGPDLLDEIAIDSA